jgi:hypothetical protein
MRHDLLGFGDFQKLDVAVLQLHNAVVRAPRVTITPADSETSASIEIRDRIKVADDVHEVVKTLRHRAALRTHRDNYFTDENAVGTSS